MLTISAFLCGVATLLFAYAGKTWVIEISRWLMGAGATTSLIGTLTVARAWLTRRAFLIASGLTMFVGTIGAILGGEPLLIIMSNTSLKHVMLLVAMLSFLIAILIYAIVRMPDSSSAGPKNTNHRVAHIWKNVVTLFSIKQIWLTSLCLSFLYVPVVTYFALWSLPFLTDTYQTTLRVVELAVMFSFVGLGVGSLLAAFVSNLVHSRIWPLRLSIMCVFILHILIIYIHPRSGTYLVIFSGLLGLFLGSAVITVAIIRELADESVAATAFSFNNMMQLLVGSLMIPLVGYLLVKDAGGIHVNNLSQYTLHNFHVALLVLPISSIVSLIISFFIRETYTAES